MRNDHCNYKKILINKKAVSIMAILKSVKFIMQNEF